MFEGQENYFEISVVSDELRLWVIESWLYLYEVATPPAAVSIKQLI